MQREPALASTNCLTLKSFDTRVPTDRKIEEKK
jgi:hypothetical protein